MIVFRCTQRLARRFGIQFAETLPTSTGSLGDWYANLLGAGFRKWVLCVSERTLLPVIIPVKSDTFRKDFQLVLRELLLRLGVDEGQLAREVAESSEVAFAPTRNRQVLGVLNDFAVNAEEFAGRLQSFEAVIEACLWLAEMPSKAIAYESPDRFTRYLFAAKRTNQ